MKHSNIFRHPAMIELQRAIIRECRLKQLCAVIVLFIGMFMLLFAFEKSVWLSITGLAILVVGIQLIYQTFTVQNPSDHPIMRYLREKPKSVVWVYSIVTERIPFGFQFSKSGTLYFKMEDGEEYSVSLPHKKLKLVSKVLNRILPHALFGYSKEKESLYSRDPKNLKNNFMRD